jgi:hypothetical protein
VGLSQVKNPGDDDAGDRQPERRGYEAVRDEGPEAVVVRVGRRQAVAEVVAIDHLADEISGNY